MRIITLSIAHTLLLSSAGCTGTYGPLPGEWAEECPPSDVISYFLHICPENAHSGVISFNPSYPHFMFYELSDGEDNGRMTLFPATAFPLRYPTNYQSKDEAIRVENKWREEQGAFSRNFEVVRDGGGKVLRIRHAGDSRSAFMSPSYSVQYKVSGERLTFELDDGSKIVFRRISHKYVQAAPL